MMKQEVFDTTDDAIGPPEHKAVSSPEAELVERIVATPAFVRSALLTRFLRYICDCKLCGREEEIAEYRIGVQALGRPDAYNPGEDNIVRNYARILRKRLHEYFTGEGRDEPVRIVIPVGHYIPVFEPNLPLPKLSSVSTENRALKDSPQTTKSRGVFGARAPRRARRVWISLLFLLVAGTAAFFYQKSRPQPISVNEIFWKQIFGHNRAAFLVPGDSGFVMLQDITGKEVHLNDYISGDLESKFPDFNLTASRKGTRYGPERFSSITSTADLSIALGVASLEQRYGGHVLVRYARDMHMEDFKGANVILVGGPHANPWDELFEPESNFRMLFPMRLDGMHTDERSFLNKHPRAGEQAVYSNEAGPAGRLAYTLVSFLPGIDRGSFALLIEGQNMPGTQAGGDFLLDQSAMQPILKKAQMADGSIGPFEILLEERTIGANAARARVVAERFSVAKTSE